MYNSYTKSIRSYILISPFFILLFCMLATNSCSGNPEKTLRKIANDTKNVLPQIIDEYTTMIDCEAISGGTLKFTYAVKGMNFLPSQRMEIEQKMKEVLIDRLKGRKEFEFYLENNVRFEHVFRDENKKEMLHINIEALDYK